MLLGVFNITCFTKERINYINMSNPTEKNNNLS